MGTDSGEGHGILSIVPSIVDHCRTRLASQFHVNQMAWILTFFLASFAFQYDCSHHPCSHAHAHSLSCPYCSHDQMLLWREMTVTDEFATIRANVAYIG